MQRWQGFDSGHHPWSSLDLLFSVVPAVFTSLTLGGSVGIPPTPDFRGKPVTENSGGASEEGSRVTEEEKRQPGARVTNSFEVAAHGRAGNPSLHSEPLTGEPTGGAPGGRWLLVSRAAGTAPLVTAEIPTGASRSFEPRLEQVPRPEGDLF